MTYPFPSTEKTSSALYASADAAALWFFGALSQNMWEGYCTMSGDTSGHQVVSYTGPYSVIKAA